MTSARWKAATLVIPRLGIRYHPGEIPRNAEAPAVRLGADAT